MESKKDKNVNRLNEALDKIKDEYPTKENIEYLNKYLEPLGAKIVKNNNYKTKQNGRKRKD